MKESFYKIPIEKRNKIIKSGINIFSKNGYNNGSMDLIVQDAGISKGGLYEYVENKEDFYIFLVNHVYGELYDYIKNYFKENNIKIPRDILERFFMVSKIAIDFYIEHPEYIEFIVKTKYIADNKLQKRVEHIFLKRFLELFSDFDESNLRYDKNKTLDLIRWLLLKTREDFLNDLYNIKEKDKVKKKYLENWEFYITILKEGIYKKVKF